MHRIDGTIFGGLPIIIEYSAHRGDRDIGEPNRYCEVNQILTSKSKPIPKSWAARLTEADWDNLREQAERAEYDT